MCLVSSLQSKVTKTPMFNVMWIQRNADKHKINSSLREGKKRSEREKKRQRERKSERERERENERQTERMGERE